MLNASGEVITLQDIQDKQGFIILAYTSAEDLSTDDDRGVTDGNTMGTMYGIEAHIIGPASLDEWKIQCDLCSDPYFCEVPWVDFRKVIVE